MVKKIEELVTHEVYVKNGVYHLQIPVTKLIHPKFLLKESENSLYIFLFNYSLGYVIKEIAPDVIGAIKSGRCYLVEGLLNSGNTEHYIDLMPSSPI